MSNDTLNKRIYGLDILRALAILEVLYNHAFRGNNPYYFFLFDGVTLFFALSGFLIGTILLTTIHSTQFNFKNLLNFWIRRWLRTLPAYFFVLFFLISYQLYSDKAQTIFQFKNYFFFTQNITKGWPKFFIESWSLGVEEWFYLLAPLLFLFSFRLIKNRKNIILFWIIAIIAGVSLLRIYRAYTNTINTGYEWQFLLGQSVVTRIDGIMYGLLGAYLYFHKYSFWLKKNLFFYAGIFIFIFCSINLNLFRINWFTVYLQLPLQSIASLFILPKLVSVKTGNGYVFKVLTFISVISYSMYLINLSMFNIISGSHVYKTAGKYIFDSNSGFAIYTLATYLIWSFSGAWILYILVEKPFMRLRKHIALFKNGEAGFTEHESLIMTLKNN